MATDLSESEELLMELWITCGLKFLKVRTPPAQAISDCSTIIRHTHDSLPLCTLQQHWLNSAGTPTRGGGTPARGEFNHWHWQQHLSSDVLVSEM